MIGAAAGSYYAGRSTRSRGMVSSGGVRFSKERHRVGKLNRRKIGKLADTLSMLNKWRLRWQMTSPSLVGPGRIPIGFGSNAYGETVLPIHMISLTNNGKGNDNVFKGSSKKGLFRIIRNENDGTTGWNYFDCQTAAGVNNYNNTGHWEIESNESTVADKYCIYHKWTEIKMNLYGSKYLPLEYTISIIQVPQNYDPQKFADSTTGTLPAGEFDEVSRWFTDLSRSLISNPINKAATREEWRNNVKIIKQYKVNIGPLSYENANSETTAPVHVGNVKQFNCFLRHDRWRDYNWTDQTENIVVDRSLGDLGWDKEGVDKNFADVQWGKKLYLMITCTSGPLVTGAPYDTTQHTPYQYTSIPNYEGTYDILVRNEFRTF